MTDVYCESVAAIFSVDRLKLPCNTAFTSALTAVNPTLETVAAQSNRPMHCSKYTFTNNCLLDTLINAISAVSLS